MEKINNKKGKAKMSMTIWIVFGFASILTLLAFIKGADLPIKGFKAGGSLFLTFLPILIFAFIAAGMITVVLPKEVMSRWLGEESGIRGLIIATLAGALTPGGPFVQFPIVAALLKAGASIAPLVAYISAWSLLGVNRFIIWEIPLLGWKLAVCRFSVALFFPIIMGILTRFIYLRLS